MKQDDILHPPIQLGIYLSGNEFLVLFYLLFRSNLPGYRFYISTMTDELSLTDDTIRKILRKFKSLGFVNQDEAESNRRKHYHLDYLKCHTWIEARLKEYKKLLKKKRDKRLAEETARNIQVTITQKNLEVQIFTDY